MDITRVVLKIHLCAGMHETALSLHERHACTCYSMGVEVYKNIFMLYKFKHPRIFGDVAIHGRHAKGLFEHARALKNMVSHGGIHRSITVVTQTHCREWDCGAPNWVFDGTDAKRYPTRPDIYAYPTRILACHGSGLGRKYK